MSMTLRQAADALDRSSAAAGSLLVKELRTTASRALESVVGQWPVATGESLDGWAVQGTAIVNGVDYAADVHNGLADQLVPEQVALLDQDTQQRLDARLQRVVEGG